MTTTHSISHPPLCLWLTGLPCSGKTTLAYALAKKLAEKKIHTYLLDGDELRAGLNRDLSFTDADRAENIRRAGELAHLKMSDGLVVIAAFVSPHRAERLKLRNLFSVNEFIEIFVDAPLAECEARDVKGLYAQARRGELKNFTGIDSVYEVPQNPDLRLETHLYSVDECVEKIIAKMFSF